MHVSLYNEIQRIFFIKVVPEYYYYKYYHLYMQGKQLTVFTEDPNYNLHYADGMLFTTFDQNHSFHNCGFMSHGGWWYWFCAYANANGQYAPGTDSSTTMHYQAFLNNREGLVATKLMFK